MAAVNPFALEIQRRAQAPRVNPFAAELERRRGAEPDEDSAAETFGLSLSRRFINNALGLPSAAGKAVLAAGAGVATGANKLLGRDQGFQEMFEIAKRESVLDDIPAPTIEEIGAGFRSLPALMPGGQSFGDRLRDEKIGIEADMARMREAHPGHARAGDVSGDALTLIGGRVPFAKSINKAESALLPRAEIFFGRAVPQIADPGARRFVQRVLDAKPVRQLARGAGRSLEAGFEATALDVLHGDDPFETAGYVAGAQASGSLILHLGKGLFSGGPMKAGLKLGMAAAATGSLIQVLKSATPGGKNFSLESLESGFDKVAFGMAMGAVAGTVGGGRLFRGSKTAEDFPRITDAIATIPRAATIGILEDIINSDPQTQQVAQTVLSELSRNPMAFGEDAMNRLNTAMESGEFIEELNKLKQEREFQQKLFSLNPPALGGGGGF